MRADLQYGIITGYTIRYQSQTENDNGFVEACPNDRQATPTGLKEFVYYTISVVAFTVKGDGPPSVVSAGLECIRTAARISSSTDILSEDIFMQQSLKFIA